MDEEWMLKCSMMSHIQFNQLPAEVFLNAFSYLTFKELRGILPVCRLWRRLGEDPSLYKSICFKGKDGVGSRRICKFLNGKIFLRQLHVHDVRYSSQIVERAGASCPKLQHIMLTNAPMTNTALKSVADNCSYLSTLCFEKCDFTECDLSELSRLKNVTSLDLVQCVVRDVEEVQEMLAGFPLLESLAIWGLSSHAGPVRSHRGIPSKCDSLHKLLFDGKELKEGELVEICSNKENLHIFYVDSIHHSGDDILSIFNIRSLVLLKVTYSRIDASVWENAFQHHRLSHLRYLVLDGCQGIENHLKMIGEAFPLLSLLSIGVCAEVTDEGITSFIDSCNPSLKYLIAKELNVNGFCLAGIPCKLAMLAFLNLRGCQQLDTSLVADLIKRMPELGISCWYPELEMDVTNERFDVLQEELENEGFYFFN